MAEQNGVSLRVQTPMQPIGVSGLKQWGVVREEFLQELSGPVGVKTYMKMRDNSPIVGAILFAVRDAAAAGGLVAARRSMRARKPRTWPPSPSTRSLRTACTRGMCGSLTSSRCSPLAGRLCEWTLEAAPGAEPRPVALLFCHRWPSGLCRYWAALAGLPSSSGSSTSVTRWKP